jgi:hypothetical protein
VGIAALWAMPRSASSQVLYVAEANGTVGKYNATTGVCDQSQLHHGLSLAYGLAVSGNTLFVSDLVGGTVGEYDATTGAAINGSETGSATTLAGTDKRFGSPG